MAQYTMQQYEAMRQASSNQGNRELPKIHFMKEYLDKDGDFAIVRFPYASMADLVYESVHHVNGVFPNAPYGKNVSCSGDDNCPLCKSTDPEVSKKTMRFYAKFIVYTQENGQVVLNPTIWDRPSAFGDVDLKNLMTEYGDLTNYLFKVVRSGSKTDTRYNIIPVLNKAVYPDNQYVRDFTVLNDIDAVKICTKSVAQYNAIVNPQPEAAQTVETAQATQAAATQVQTQQVETKVVNQPTQQATQTVTQTATNVQQTQTNTQPTQTNTTGTPRYRF